MNSTEIIKISLTAILVFSLVGLVGYATLHGIPDGDAGKGVSAIIGYLGGLVTMTVGSYFKGAA